MFTILQGAQYLAQGLQINKTLLWLGLGSNRIAVQGVWALSESLRCGSSLLWLGLGGNNVGDRGVLHLASLLQGLEPLIMSCTKYMHALINKLKIGHQY